jgi:endoglucanase
VHFYDPYIFTHQGETWDDHDPVSKLANVPFPIDPSDPRVIAIVKRFLATGGARAAALVADFAVRAYGVAEVEAAFDELGAFIARARAPVIVNEFGVLRFVAPRADRLVWIRAVREAAERRCIGFAQWDLQDGFGLAVETGGRPVIDPDNLEALTSGKGN